MAARQVIFTVCDLVQPVWQQRGPVPAWGVKTSGHTVSPVVRQSSPSPPHSHWLSCKAASFASPLRHRDESFCTHRHLSLCWVFSRPSISPDYSTIDSLSLLPPTSVCWTLFHAFFFPGKECQHGCSRSVSSQLEKGTSGFHQSKYGVRHMDLGSPMYGEVGSPCRGPFQQDVAELD